MTSVDNLQTSTNEPHSHPPQFPAGLVEWAGHQKGGVRKPFYEGSGRPCKQIIETPLLGRLRKWAADLAANSAGTPRSLFLVGGPGNGKTEAIEQFIVALDQILHADGGLIRKCSEQFAGTSECPVPRLITVELIIQNIQGDMKMEVVQDASMTDPRCPNQTAPELFLAEANQAAAASLGRIYLACVNRGILDDALIASGSGKYEEGRKLLEAIIRSIALSPHSPSCWPLEGYPSVAAWPMDVETLITRPNNNICEGPAGQILAKALDPAQWALEGSCPAQEKCPFCGSHTILQREQERTSLLSILRWTELALGKRWNFRDLFSLYSYLLAGGGSEGSASTSPCEWAARLLELIQRPAGSNILRLKAPFILATSLYQHALFSKWPRPNARSLRKDIKDLGLDNDSGLMGLYYFLTTPHGTSMPAALQSQLNLMSEALDPAMADPESYIEISTRKIVFGQDVDARFSQSILEGHEQCRRLLHPLENDVLKRLMETDEKLSSPNIRLLRPAVAKRLQNLVRDFASRFVRRSLGVRYGIVCDQATLVDFQHVVERNPQLVHKAVKQVEGLLNEGERFIVTLNSTFGEPVLPQLRRATLSITKQRVRHIEDRAEGKPDPAFRFLSIGNGARAHLLPLTYDLFSAVRKLEEGMRPASLSRAVVALLDASRAKLAGGLVRDGDALEDAEIRLGTMGIAVRSELGQFVVSREDDL